MSDPRGMVLALAQIPPDAGRTAGREVWETCWRKTHTDKLVSDQCTLIVARHVLTGETKYFLSNCVPGRDGWSLRQILRVAFGR